MKQANRYHDLIDIWRAAIAAVEPYDAVRKAMQLEGDRLNVAGTAYDLRNYHRVLVIGAGKATARMAAAVETVIGDRITWGLIIVKHGHTTPLRFIQQVEAGHPIPDSAGVKATREIMEHLREADDRTLVVCLFSGGGSALLSAPAKRLSLADKQRTTELLLKAGASIEELNAVRKHCSAVKGGRLVKLACPATVLALLISDVLLDRLDVIASGPTAPDNSTFADALAVINKYGLKASLPKEIITHLEHGATGGEEDTVKEHDPCFAKTQNCIVAGLDQAIGGAMDSARLLGMNAQIVTRELRGEARDAARHLAQEAVLVQDRLKNGERLYLVSGGETTVTVKGTGKGGRNQELALAFAIEIAGKTGIEMLSAGTDGTDGPTDADGAFVDGGTVHRATELGLNAVDYLANNDSYSFFQKFDARAGTHVHLKTGPTGTNVMDIQVMLIER